MTPKRRPTSRTRLQLSMALLSLALVACERAPTDGMREWKATDHDRAGSSANDRMGPRMQGPTDGAEKKANENANLAELAWRNQCASCHGASGRGDGPTGPMVGAPDLTTPAMQGRLKDADVFAAVKNGKGKMPKFDLPDDVVLALVLKVRQLGGGGAR